jgi:hypothetical protein
MNFESALGLMRVGIFVRMASWPQGLSICLDREQKNFISQDGARWIPETVNLVAQNWEITNLRRKP